MPFRKYGPHLYVLIFIAIGFACRAFAAAQEEVELVPVHAEGIENVFRIGESLYSGSAPDSGAAFESLKRLGIKTVISVDGSKPDVDAAHKAGLRYVHIPFGYDGISRERALEIAKALQSYPGPFYIHCHHGKHRGPAAAAIALMCTDGSCSTARALEVMKAAGTDPRYKGLFRSVEEFARPSSDDLQKVAETLPEVAQTDDLTQAMVEIDRHWDNLKAAKAAGWKTPPDHPDIDPAHEALQVVELYREIGRMQAVSKRPEDFRQILKEAENRASGLEKVLREKYVPAAIAATFSVAGESCTECHTKYRDNK
ncbi:MAG: hypothetical protein K1Y02_09585 [Candidatus Hydrogenedentes bacterium]|nr:hypothetical protein [Candidatus Hydrogenedentota bacterium]